MPDTKSGRERKGRNKRRQLESHLNEREVETLSSEDEPPRDAESVDSEFLVSPSESETDRAGDD